MYKIALDPSNQIAANFAQAPFVIYSSNNPNKVYKEIVRDGKIPMSAAELILIRTSPKLIESDRRVYVPLLAETILTGNFLHLYKQDYKDRIKLAIDNWHQMPVENITWHNEYGEANDYQLPGNMLSLDTNSNLNQEDASFLRKKIMGPTAPIAFAQLAEKNLRSPALSLSIPSLRLQPTAPHRFYPIAVEGLTHNNNMGLIAKGRAQRGNELIHVLGVSRNFDQKRKDTLRSFGIVEQAISVLEEQIYSNQKPNN